MNRLSSIGRITLGFFSDRIGPQNVLCFAALVVVIDTFALWIPTSSGGIGMLFAFGIVYGFFAGALLSMVPTVLASTFGVQNFGAKMGLLCGSDFERFGLLSYWL